jgi:predicted extracellular nuclease
MPEESIIETPHLKMSHWLRKIVSSKFGGVCVLFILTGCISLFAFVFTGTGSVTKIHTIQGSQAISPEAGAIHTIEGVVIGDFQESDQLRGIFIQEEDSDIDSDPKTSEAIFVYMPNGPDVKVGDIVRITGKVAEFYECTQLQNVSSIRVINTTASLPVAAQISLPLANSDFLECYEGMLATFPQTLTVTDTYYLGRYGQITLSSGGRLLVPTHAATPGAAANALQEANTLNHILLDDGSRVKNPDPVIHPSPRLSASNTLRIGDTVTDLTGIIHYSFDHYRLHPTITPVFAAANVRSAEPPPVGGSLKVASFNLLNYFTTIDNGKNGARGADSSSEFTRQHEKIISAIMAMDADILGILELENTKTTTITNLVDSLNNAAGRETYAYIETGRIGNDQIRVALIYQPDAVTPAGAYMIDNSSIFERPPLAQTFEDSSGERFSIVLNHFKSKRCQDASGPDLDQKDGQGCYNHKRTQQTAQLLTFIETTVIPASADSDVLIIGDLNAYARETPITTVERAGYTNLIDRFMGAETYSYVFFGQSGYLSHALASSSLTAQVTDLVVWHINADEPRVLDYNEEDKSPEQLVDLYHADPYRSSDHDPVLIGLELKRLL